MKKRIKDDKETKKGFTGGRQRSSSTGPTMDTRPPTSQEQHSLTRSYTPENVAETSVADSDLWFQFRHGLARTQGNQAMQQLVENGLRPKLEVTRPDDRYEREADRVAMDVLRMPEPEPADPGPGDTESSTTDRSARSDMTLRRSIASSTLTEGEGTADLGRAIQRDNGGRQLPTPVRSFFEPRFGADFSEVTIHTGATDAELSRTLFADAFTYGTDIYFGEGNYDPSTEAGRMLLAHELTHVLQQTRRPATPASRGVDGDRETPHRQRPRSVQKNTRAVVQRQRQEAATEGQLQQQPPAPTASEQSRAIDRDWLIQRIGFRMGIAFSKFVDACSEHQRKLREIAAEQAEMASLVLDVVLSFATPGLGRMVTSAISRSVRTGASTAVYRLALGAMDRSDQIVSATTAVGKDMAKDAFKAAVARAEEEQFVQALKQRFSVVLDRIHESLQTKTDEELSVLYVNYDPEIATFEYYERQIGQLVRRYQAQVAPIGGGERQVSPYHVYITKNLAYWIELPQGTYLGLVETPEMVWPFDARFEFIGWVGRSMADLAIEKTKQVTGHEPRRISAADVHGIPIRDLVSGRPPATRQ